MIPTHVQIVGKDKMGREVSYIVPRKKITLLQENIDSNSSSSLDSSSSSNSDGSSSPSLDTSSSSVAALDPTAKPTAKPTTSYSAFIERSGSKSIRVSMEYSDWLKTSCNLLF